MDRGEVWWVEHPDTGRRPYLEPICQLSPVRMVQACRALSVALGC